MCGLYSSFKTSIQQGKSVTWRKKFLKNILECFYLIHLKHSPGQTGSYWTIGLGRLNFGKPWKTGLRGGPSGRLVLRTFGQTISSVIWSCGQLNWRMLPRPRAKLRAVCPLEREARMPSWRLAQERTDGLIPERTPGKVAGIVHTPDSLGPHLVLDSFLVNIWLKRGLTPWRLGHQPPAKMLTSDVVGILTLHFRKQTQEREGLAQSTRD